jgi:hypothetical protein
MTPGSILLWIKNVSHKSCREIKIHILCSTTFFFFENRTFYEIMWKDVAEPDRTHRWQNNTAHALCALYNYGYRHSENVILIGFPRQQWLREAPQCYFYTSVACLVYVTLCGTYSLTYDMSTRQIRSYVLLNFINTSRYYRGLNCKLLKVR